MSASDSEARRQRRQVSGVESGGEEPRARRCRHVEGPRRGRRPRRFEPQLDRHRRRAAVVTEGVHVGPRSRRRAQRSFGGDGSDSLSAGGHHRGDVHQPQAERALGEEPGFVALQAIGRELRGASVPGQRTSIEAVRGERDVRLVSIEDRRFGRGDQSPRGGHLVLRGGDDGFPVGHAERHQPQLARHPVEVGADPGFRAFACLGFVRSKEHALGQPAGGERQQRARGASQANPEEARPGGRRRGRGTGGQPHGMIVGLISPPCLVTHSSPRSSAEPSWLRPTGP
jgi:hypothetical protein